MDRRWQAGPGQALMVSAGFRPSGLALADAWRISAVVALAMLEAAERMLGPQLAPGDRLALKWPNDVVAVHESVVRKLGGVLAEGVADGDRLSSAAVGIGVNVDWPALEFPEELAATMWSLREVAGQAVDREALLESWVDRLAPGYERLRDGAFDGASWAAAQVTTGADLEVELGSTSLAGRGLGVDPETGALRLESADGTVHEVAWGEVVRCRVGQVPRHL
jgi:BirA family biotin operon repressor/biotin-[acetyl-CoA-carboxylase] ligase